MAKGRETTAEVDGGEEAPDTDTDVQVDISNASEPVGPATSMPDLDFVKGLIAAVDGSGIDSLEITRAGTRVKISKTPPSAGPAPTYVAAAPQSAPPQAPPPAPAPPASNPGSGAAPATGAEPEGSESSESPVGDGLVDITSPMVGTFYRAPAPDAPPYVEVGSQIGKGQTLCILEAMKLMNELEAELDGEIREILVENAEPVEYGQVLFRVEPS